LFLTIMTTAVEDDLLLRNPVRIKGASAERIIERPLLRWPEVAALADAINPRFDAPVWAVAESGLRFGELTGLTMDHVDLDRCELRVSHERRLASRFHDLRHLAGTAAATAGASLREVMARMGHSSSAASLRYLKSAKGR
jgi:integrase